MRSHNETDKYSGPENREINDYLRKKHGNGFTALPLYRLVHSQFVTKLSPGEWHDWDPNLPVAHRGTLVAGYSEGQLLPETQAERRVIEMRRCPEYPELYHTPGWILERWMAPAYYGSRTEWESRKFRDTEMPEMGPYPIHGKYMLVAGPYPEPPSGPFLDRLIEMWGMMRDETLALCAETYQRKRWYDAEQEDKRRSARWHRESSAANMTAMQSMFSTFLEGGKARQLAAEHAGIQSNYGN